MRMMNELNFDLSDLYKQITVDCASKNIKYSPFEQYCSYDVIGDLRSQIDTLHNRIDDEKSSTIGLSESISSRLTELENQNKNLRKMVLELYTLVLTKIGNDQLKK